MSIEMTPSRRTVLVAGAGALTLAACSSSAGSTGATAGGTAGGTAGATGGATTGATAGSAPGGGASSDAGGNALTTLDAVPVGGAVAVQLPGGRPGIVARPTATTAVAFSAICTHQGCTVAPAGAKLNCPCHGSVYNALTGAVEVGAFGAPADGQAPLPKVGVKVVGGKVVPA
jgi:Rieske Fe-S protein